MLYFLNCGEGEQRGQFTGEGEQRGQFTMPFLKNNNQNEEVAG